MLSCERRGNAKRVEAPVRKPLQRSSPERTYKISCYDVVGG